MSWGHWGGASKGRWHEGEPLGHWEAWEQIGGGGAKHFRLEEPRTCSAQPGASQRCVPESVNRGAVRAYGARNKEGRAVPGAGSRAVEKVLGGPWEALVLGSGEGEELGLRISKF